MQRKVIYIIVGFVILLLASCSRRPGYVISPQKMTDVLYDIRLTQSIYNADPQFNSDEMKDALVEGVLRKHQITQVELDSSLLWYSDNIKYYVEINDSVASRLKAKNESLMNLRTASISNKDRNANLIIPTFYYLDVYSPTLSFNIDSTKIKNIKNISDFHLRFDVQGIHALQHAEAAVYFNYKDTVIRSILPINKNSNYSINKPQLPDSLLKSISGYIHLEHGLSRSSSNVLLYNVSYIDSLGVQSKEHRPIGSDHQQTVPSEVIRNTTPPRRQVEPLKEEPIQEEVNKESNKETRIRPPVIPKKKIDRNPSLRRDPIPVTPSKQ